ncbi:MAG: siroheme synthase, partial [Proteobacteria bacterium]|nr:siroheme synthase [Pseudomonadota bacterium]
VDVPHLCDFYVPSVIHRGPLTVAISSGGCSPAFSRNFRRHLDQHIHPTLGQYMELLAAARAEVKLRLPDDEKRRMKLNSDLVECGADRLVEAGDIEAARSALWRLIDGEATRND